MFFLKTHSTFFKYCIFKNFNLVGCVCQQYKTVDYYLLRFQSHNKTDFGPNTRFTQ